jgi:hypothetical protein
MKKHIRAGFLSTGLFLVLFLVVGRERINRVVQKQSGVAKLTTFSANPKTASIIGVTTVSDKVVLISDPVIDVSIDFTVLNSKGDPQVFQTTSGPRKSISIPGMYQHGLSTKKGRGVEIPRIIRGHYVAYLGYNDLSKAPEVAIFDVLTGRFWRYLDEPGSTASLLVNSNDFLIYARRDPAGKKNYLRVLRFDGKTVRSQKQVLIPKYSDALIPLSNGKIRTYSRHWLDFDPATGLLTRTVGAPKELGLSRRISLPFLASASGSDPQARWSGASFLYEIGQQMFVLTKFQDTVMLTGDNFSHADCRKLDGSNCATLPGWFVVGEFDGSALAWDPMESESQGQAFTVRTGN